MKALLTQLQYIADSPPTGGGGFHSEAVKTARAALRALRPRFCRWTYDDLYDYFSTSCKHEFSFNEGGLQENNVRFCHHCGKRVKEVKA